jgi:Metallo-peptidase family M12/Domain of unknown function DUF11
MRFASRKAGAYLLGMALLGCGGLAWPAQPEQVRLLEVRTAQLRSSVMAQSATSGVDAGSLRVEVRAGSDQHVLMLRVNHSLGEWAARQQPASVAFEGYLPNLTGSWVRVTRSGTRWAGIWFDGANYFGIDTAGGVAAANADAAAAAPDGLVVFRMADAISEGPVLVDDMVLPVLTGEGLADRLTAELRAPATAAVLSPMRRLLVGLIADAELVALDGASTSANLLARLNVVDGIFASQVGVRIHAEAPTLLEAATQPFTGTRAGTLLDQLSVYRNATMLQRGTGLSHLMTGRDLDGQTVGIAFLSDIANGVALCTNRYSASVSEARRFVSYDGLIAAHEIGHVFGAPHDGETEPDGDQSCAAVPPTFLMGATINSSQTFSSCSLEQMTPVIEIAKLQCLTTFDTDLSVVASFDAANVALGSDTAATLTVRNLGNVAVSDAQLSVTVPAGLSVTTVTATGINCALNGSTVSCTPSALAANASASVRLTLRGAAAGIATLATNISSSVADPQTGNNQAQASITVNTGTPAPATNPTSSGGGRMGIEVLLALLLAAQRAWMIRSGRQAAVVAK